MTRVPLSIVRTPEPLAEQYLPPAFPGREALVQELAESCLAERPLHAVRLWLHGPPGVGKTSVARWLLDQLEHQHVRTAYVNCWSAQTFFAVLETVFNELRALVGDVRDVSFKYERLVRLAREHRIAIVLDEVDQLFLKERNAALYNFARLDGATLVCISQSRAAYSTLDPRVQSRLRPHFVELPPYSRDDLVAILAQRAAMSLEPTAYCTVDLERLAEAARGDARVAVQGLRNAGYLAEKDHSPTIRVDDIDAGLQQARELRRKYALSSLSEHHRLLYRIVKDAKTIPTTEAWRTYLNRAPEEGLDPMSRRTFTHYKRYLVSSGLLLERQRRGRLNQRVLEVVG